MTAPRLTPQEVAAAVRSAPADSPLAELARLVIHHLDVFDAHRAGGDPNRSEGLGPELDHAEWAVRAAVGLPSIEAQEREHATIADLVRESVGGLRPDPMMRRVVWRRLRSALRESWWRRAWRWAARRRQS